MLAQSDKFLLWGKVKTSAFWNMVVLLTTTTNPKKGGSSNGEAYHE
jgi:hypothetical protein